MDTVGDEDECPTFYYKGTDGNYSNDDVYIEKIDIDNKIADISELSAIGIERYISCSHNKLLLTTVQCTRWSISNEKEKELLSSLVDYNSTMKMLVNSLNKIELHTQKCKKCEDKMIDKKAWILDSSASQHFMSSKEDFIDYEVITDALEVQTASAKAILHVEGQGSILLSHLVENQGAPVIVTMHIYPVLYIPRLSMKLLSMGFFLVNNNHEVCGNRFHITFHNVKSHKPLLSVYLQNPRDTIYWVVPQLFDEASHTLIYKVNYDIWHKRLGHPLRMC